MQSTGSMIFPSPSETRERHLRLVPSGDDLNWDPTPMDVGSAVPGLRDAIVMFSGALDDICEGMRIAVVKGFDGQMNLLGSLPRVAMPFSYIDVPGGSGQVDEMSDILEAFERVANELGLTQREMFSATGIKKRTYHSWKRKPPSARPRVSSQGRFWRLVDMLEDLRETVDRPLTQWLRGDERRLDALLDGRFDDLVDAAVSRQAYPRRSVGASAYTGVTEDIDTPVTRTGKTNIEDVEDGL